MVDIDKYILSVLQNASEAGVFCFEDMVLPLYGYMPDFGDNEPSDYIVYTYYDTPQLYADNQSHAREFTVTIHIFTQSANPRLENEVESLMESKGFLYQGSIPRDVTSDYPGKYRKNQDYKITFNKEEEYV